MDAKKGKGIKLLTLIELLIRFPVPLAQIKTKQKTKSDKYYIFCVNIIKPPKYFTTI